MSTHINHGRIATPSVGFLYLSVVFLYLSVGISIAVAHKDRAHPERARARESSAAAINNDRLQGFA